MLNQIVLAELMDVLEEVEGKAIIWANYIHDIEHIVSALKKKYGDDSVVPYYGAVPSEQRQTNIEKFQDPKSNYTGSLWVTLKQVDMVSHLPCAKYRYLLF
jgi:superfamily II DNA helicase RecQ